MGSPVSVGVAVRMSSVHMVPVLAWNAISIGQRPATQASTAAGFVPGAMLSPVSWGVPVRSTVHRCPLLPWNAIENPKSAAVAGLADSAATASPAAAAAASHRHRRLWPLCADMMIPSRRCVNAHCGREGGNRPDMARKPMGGLTREIH
jgi:hypothetical protein